MTIFNFISLLGGLALFLYGMTIMSNGLEHLSDGKLETALKKMTGNVLKSVLLGAIVTIAIQSSSATTVIVVGLVNAKILKLDKAIGVIMGANIGTTITAHILRLTDLDTGTNLLLGFFKPTNLAPLAALIGILLYYVSRRSQGREFGNMLLGFCILFTGMFSMESAVEPLRHSEKFAEVFASFSNPILGVLVGTGVTAIIQSSTASVGMLQAMTSTGAITFSNAFPIIMGQNIGTCITPVLASIGASRNGKRSAIIHVSFNAIGTILFLIGVYAIQYAIGIPFWNDPIDKGGIANFHSFFNIIVTILFLPFTSLLEKLAYFIIKPTDEELSPIDEYTAILDDRFLSSPGFAIQQAREAVETMADLALENYDRSVNLLDNFDKKELDKAREIENILDRLQSQVDIYLLKITSKELTQTENTLLSEVLQVVNEFERIGDHADNFCDVALQMNEKGIRWSDIAMHEIEVVTEAVREILSLATDGYKRGDTSLALSVEPLEEVINILVETLKVRHSDRLQRGECNAAAAFPFVETLYNLERIADHCSNIGVHIISYNGKEKVLDRHEYLRELHRRESGEYRQKFEIYDNKYYTRILKYEDGNQQNG